MGSALLGEFRRANPPVAADQGHTVEQLLTRAEERRAERRLKSLKRGCDPDGRPPAAARPLDGLPAAMISRVMIHVDGPSGAGKTTFVERLLAPLCSG